MKLIQILFLLTVIVTTLTCSSHAIQKSFTQKSKNSHYTFTQHTHILEQQGNTCGYHALWNIITNENPTEQINQKEFDKFFNEYFPIYGTELTQVHLWEICEDKNLQNIIIIQSLDLMENEMFVNMLLPALHREELDVDNNTESLTQIAQRFNLGEKIYCILNIANERNEEATCTADAKTQADLGHWILLTATKKPCKIMIEIYDSLKEEPSFNELFYFLSNLQEKIESAKILNEATKKLFVNIIPCIANPFIKFLCKFINHYDNPAQYQPKLEPETKQADSHPEEDQRTMHPRKNKNPKKSLSK